MKKSVGILIVVVIISTIIICFQMNKNQQDIEIADEQTATTGLSHQDQDKEQDLISMITVLEKNIATICELSIEDNEDIRVINSNLFALLVRNRYGINSKQFMSMFWCNILSELDSDILDVLNERNENQEQRLYNSSFRLLVEAMYKYTQAENQFNEEEIDFQHMVAVIDVNYCDISIDDQTERYIDYLAGWGGDLLTYFGEELVIIDENKLTDEVEIRNFLVEGFKAEKSITFSKSDFYADIDGVNIAYLMNEKNLLLSRALDRYSKYSRDEKYSLFIEHMSGIENYEKELRILYGHLNLFDGQKSENNYVNGLRTYMRIVAKGNLHRDPYRYEVEALIDAWIILWKELFIPNE